MASLGFKLPWTKTPKVCKVCFHFGPGCMGLANRTADVACQLAECDVTGVHAMQVERVRLNYKSANLRRPSKDQEMLHYQWFADMGSVEAQRAVGQISSHGPHKNTEQALRYFR